jgi:hypothetical protein
LGSNYSKFAKSEPSTVRESSLQASGTLLLQRQLPMHDAAEARRLLDKGEARQKFVLEAQ